MLENNSIAVFLMFIMSIMLIVIMGFVIWFLFWILRGAKKVTRWGRRVNSTVNTFGAFPPPYSSLSHGLVQPKDKLSKEELYKLRSMLKQTPATSRRVIEVVEYDK